MSREFGTKQKQFGSETRETRPTLPTDEKTHMSINYYYISAKLIDFKLR